MLIKVEFLWLRFNRTESAGTQAKTFKTAKTKHKYHLGKRIFCLGFPDWNYGSINSLEPKSVHPKTDKVLKMTDL